jgi:signal transduction histidine kinase
MKDDFSRRFHELRTPLNAILGWSSLLQSGELPPETAREGLAVIERNARAQAQIVEDILDVARVVTGKLKVETWPLDLENVARSHRSHPKRRDSARVCWFWNWHRFLSKAMPCVCVR